MRKALKPDETKLIGSWVCENGHVVADDTTKRIEWLLDNCLIKIATDYSGWENLYVDPNDKRYWQLMYPQGEMQGGGPPALVNISEEEARKKYDFG